MSAAPTAKGEESRPNIHALPAPAKSGVSKKLLGSVVQADDVFTMLNDAAAYRDGSFVHVPRGVAVETPISLTAVQPRAGSLLREATGMGVTLAPAYGAHVPFLHVPLQLAVGAAVGRALPDLVRTQVEGQANAVLYGPELLLVSAGFDAAAGDPLGGMRVSEDGFRELARRCRALSGRVGAVLEGGYNLETLPRLVHAALDGFTS